jgi:hypothetical protein
VFIDGIEEAQPEVVVFKNVYAIPVWHIDMNYVAYYDLFTKQKGYYLGSVKTLRYLLDASKVKV